MSVQVEQKSYEMPPKDGISIACFLTVTDINRSLDYYEKVFGGRILSRGDGTGALVPSACEYLDDSERWGRPDSGQTDSNAQHSRPESHQQFHEFPCCGYSSLL